MGSLNNLLAITSQLGAHAHDNWRHIVMGTKAGFTASMFEIEYGQQGRKHA
jgi:hypothetical protein